MKNTLKKLIQESINEVEHEYEEQQELMLLMQARSAAHWLKVNRGAKPEDVARAVDLIVSRLDEVVGMHKKM